MDSLQNSNIIATVTGATGAIGEAIAIQLAELNYQVVLLTRNQDKTTRTLERIKAKTGNPHITYKIADLSRELEIKNLSASWKGPLHILINNAAVSPPSRKETIDGIELQFATNVLGYFWMTKYFCVILGSSRHSRIVNVASYWSGGLDIKDLEFKKRPYHNHAAYRQSKQANRMLSSIFPKFLSAKNITINACHPGDVNSVLSNNLGFGGSQSPAEGARTPVWLATSDTAAGITGKYFENCKEKLCQFSSLTTLSNQLFNVCNSYTQYC